MRRSLFGLGLLLPLFLGCSAENVVAGQEKSKAEQLESSLPSWCHDTCERFLACPQDAACYCDVGEACDSCIAVDDGCEAQCAATFVRYIDAGESCAIIGERIKTCIEGVACEDLGGKDPCSASEAEMRACPDPHELDEDDVSPTVANPISNSGGGPGSNAGANPVSCLGSSGAGGGMPQNGGAQVTCEEERGGCSDGHVYSWICSQDSQGQRACACLVDSQAKSSFVPNSSDCPLLAQVNAGCGWALSQ
jgi:hypothetical protein